MSSVPVVSDMPDRNADWSRAAAQFDNLSRVENVVRVKGLLQIAKCLIEQGPIHLLLERAAHQAIAMLSRKSTSILEHKLSDLGCDDFKLVHALGRFEVDHRSDVQAPD